MEVFTNADGSLKKVRARFSRSREVNLTRWNDDIFIHINDISKCFVTGSFDRSKTKSISMKWEEVEKFRDTLSAIVPHVQQMKAEMENGVEAVPTQAQTAEFVAVPAQPVSQALQPAAVGAQSMRQQPRQPAPPPSAPLPTTPRPVRQQTQIMPCNAGRYVPY